MPRIEVIAQWKHPDTGDKYESMIGSITSGTPVTMDVMEALGDRVAKLVTDAMGYEEGPITDIAVNMTRAMVGYTGLVDILRRINDLAFEDKEDSFGPIRPSFVAFGRCIKLILELASIGGLLEPSDIGTDHNGDIRISWKKEDREAELVFPFDDQPLQDTLIYYYVYYSSNKTYGIEGNPTALKLSEWIQWAMLPSPAASVARSGPKDGNI
jgi:hypothetical protein